MDKLHLLKYKNMKEKSETNKPLKTINQMRLTILKSVLICLSMIFLFIAVTIAWYVNNSQVKVDNINVSVNDRAIELKSYGSSGVHDDLLKEILGENGEKGFWYSKVDALMTDRKMASVNWLLSDESNMRNYLDNTEVDWTDDKNKRIDYAIEPGSSGNIEFYIVPKVSGTVNVSLSLRLFPYSIQDKVVMDMFEDRIAMQELQGHILFFQNRDNNLLWIKNEVFDICIPDAVINQEYKYTIHWSWPQTFGEIVLTENDSFLNGRSLVFKDFDNGTDIRSEIVDEMKILPEKFFYSSLTKQPLDTNYDELAYIEQVHIKSTNELLQEGNAPAIQAFVDLSSYYNQADQYIGKNVDFVRVSLTAELKSVEE